MREYWVLVGGDADTVATRIVTWAAGEDAVRAAFPMATRIICVR